MRLYRIASLTASVLMTGCYTLEPVVSTPGPSLGLVMALEVNDVGRVALGGSMGPEIGVVEGRLVSQLNGEYVLAVTHVRFIRGGEQIWTGEQVSIKKEYVSRTFERRFHKGRTVALGAAIVGGILAVAVAQDLFGFGQEATPIIPPDTGTSLRPRRP